MCPTDSSVASERARHKRSRRSTTPAKTGATSPCARDPCGAGVGAGRRAAPARRRLRSSRLVRRSRGCRRLEGPDGPRRARGPGRPPPPPPPTRRRAVADPASFEDVCKERDVLRAHIAKMEARSMIGWAPKCAARLRAPRAPRPPHPRGAAPSWRRRAQRIGGARATTEGGGGDGEPTT